jgi:hydroxyacylglutathione hydrolase
MSWNIEGLVVGPIQCNCYILSESVSRKAYVIDPGAESSDILNHLQQHRLDVQAILLTHCHIDHVGGVEMLDSKLSVPIYFHQGDEFLYKNLAVQAAMFGAQPADLNARQPLKDGLRLAEDQIFPVDGGSIRVIHTPGHTPGSVCFHAMGPDNVVFTGDTLFQASIGRTDLWGGSYDAILDSIKQKLMALDDSVKVFPGHGLSTTIGIERDSNPFILGY